jgi:transposase
VVPDNPKPVVTKACRYEPDINPSFADMAAHFDVVIMPARVRKPKDKAKVEAAVGVATRWILAVLRNRTFFSLTDARHAVRELLEKLNDRPFSTILGTRRSLYESLDKPALKPLPANHYEYKQFKKVVVNNDYHIEYDRHFYSVPYRLRGAPVEIRSTFDWVEIFHLGTSVACHQRSFVENKATTVRAHRPKGHQRYDEQLRPETVIDSAVKIGPSVAALVQEVMKRARYPELGCRTCSGILSLAHKFGEIRLEEACQRSLKINALSYTAVKSNLTSSRAQALR